MSWLHDHDCVVFIAFGLVHGHQRSCPEAVEGFIANRQGSLRIFDAGAVPGTTARSHPPPVGSGIHCQFRVLHDNLSGPRILCLTRQPRKPLWPALPPLAIPHRGT